MSKASVQSIRSVHLLSAMGFCAVELALAQRDPFWNPREWGQWIGFAIAFLAIAAALSVLAAMFEYVLCRIRPTWKYSFFAKLTCSFAACAVLSVAPASLGEWRIVLLGVCLCLGFIVVHGGYWIVHRFTSVPVGTLSIVLASGPAAGIAFLIIHGAPFALLREEALVYGTTAGGLVVLANAMMLRLLGARHLGYGTVLFALPAIAAILVPSVPSLLAGNARAGAPPNIVLITCDAFRADYAETFGGHVPTPALSRLAAGGTLYRQCYATAPWTSPSIQSIFSAKFPPTTPEDADEAAHIEHMTGYRLSEDERTLAERLAAKGYTTAALIGNPLLYQPSGFLRGFQHQWAVGHLVRRPTPILRSLYVIRSAVAAYRSSWVTHTPVDSSKLLASWTHAFLANHGAEPFFLWIHFMDPHAPYNPPQAYRDESNTMEWFAPAEMAENAALLSGKDTLPSSVRLDAQRLYEGEIQHLDGRIDEILNDLDARELTNNTYICFSADHGEELWDHARWGHGHSLYNELLHVPLIYSGPRLEEQVVRVPVSTIDIVPTLASFAKIAPSKTWQGRSRSDELRGFEDTYISPVYAQGTTVYSGEPLQAVIADGHKLIRGTRTGAMTLFDLDADPGESSPLHDEQVKTELSALLDEWTASIEGPTAPDADLSEDAVEQLKSMGYLE